jgi:hypothetical protein
MECMKRLRSSSHINYNAREQQLDDIYSGSEEALYRAGGALLHTQNGLHDGLSPNQFYHI